MTKSPSLTIRVLVLAVFGLLTFTGTAKADAVPAGTTSVGTTSVRSAPAAQHATATAARRTPTHWSYNFVYDIGATTPSKAKSKLHSCFNCYFPVSGAPKAFPTRGQDLPLKAGPFNLGNFHCTFREEHSGSDQGGPYFGYTFDTASGHVDGPGAWIGFTFRTQRTGANQLNVFGYVAKNTWIPEDVYKNRADAMWSKFAKNMRS